MEKSKLREVTYNLMGWKDVQVPGFVPDEKIKKEYEDYAEDIIRERKGWFHCWGNKVLTENNAFFQETYGVVEDAETGKIEKKPLAVTNQHLLLRICLRC